LEKHNVLGRETGQRLAKHNQRRETGQRLAKHNGKRETRQSLVRHDQEGLVGRPVSG
jgi:hypothetical protein